MATAQTPVITARQWSEHKTHILNLYVEKNWPLSLVKKELAAKGFEPSESQYRSRFKKWKIRKLGKSKIVKEASTMRSDEPRHTSDITAVKDAYSSFLPLTVERTLPLHHTPLEHNEADDPYLTSVADRNDSENKDDDWDLPDLVLDHSKETVGENLNTPATKDRSIVYAEFNSHHDGPNLYAQAHVGPLADDNQVSLEMGWDELEANQYQYWRHDL